MATYEIEIGDVYVEMIEEMKNDNLSVKDFLEKTTENNVHNLYQKNKNLQKQQ